MIEKEMENWFFSVSHPMPLFLNPLDYANVKKIYLGGKFNGKDLITSSIKKIEYFFEILYITTNSPNQTIYKLVPENIDPDFLKFLEEKSYDDYIGSQGIHNLLCIKNLYVGNEENIFKWYDENMLF